MLAVVSSGELRNKNIQSDDVYMRTWRTCGVIEQLYCFFLSSGGEYGGGLSWGEERYV